MGFFSWMTQDTKKSIANTFSTRDTFPVAMIDDKGNVWREENYEGYGVFGGKDYYELLGEMNGITDFIEGNVMNDLRSKAINLAFKDNSSGYATPNVKYPNLVENPEGWEYTIIGPESCDAQGYFYDDENYHCELCDGELDFNGSCANCDLEEENE